MILTKYVRLTIISFSFLTLISCADKNGFEGIKDIPTTVDEQGEVQVDLREIESEASTATLAINSAQVEVIEVENIQLGGIWDILKIGKVKEKLMEGFDKISDKLKGVKLRLNDLRISIQLKIDQLDSTDPHHQEAILQLEKMLGKIDKLEVKMDMALDKLRLKLDKLFTKVDNLLAKISFGGWIGDVISFGLRWTLEDLKADVMYKFDELIININS